MLVEEGLGVGDAGLDVVDAVGVGKVGVDAGIGESALLSDGLLLKIGCAEIGEGVFAGIVVEGVVAIEVAGVEDGGGAEDMGVAGRDVEGLDLGALIGRTHGETVGTDSDTCGVLRPLGGVLGVVGVGGLEPGTGVAKVKADRVGAGDLIVDAVEEVFFVALVVDGLVLGRVEETAGVHSVDGDEVAGLLGAVGEVEAKGGSAKGSIGAVDVAVGFRIAQAGAGGSDDDERGLAAVLGRRRARDDFEGLD